MPVRTTSKKTTAVKKAPTEKKVTRKKALPAPPPEPVEEIIEASNEDLNTTWITAWRAADEKQAVDIRALDLRGITAMADVFFICHGRNNRQNQAICDEIQKQLKEQHGERVLAIEGQGNAEWILMDYGDLVIHIFTEAAREYYDLERLYRDAQQLQPPPK
ncbi:MAG: ribosome silencing factor [Bryobacterales bacterium]|nr:ribosome silencing factor [Bryobacterales bacterium]